MAENIDIKRIARQEAEIVVGRREPVITDNVERRLESMARQAFSDQQRQEIRKVIEEVLSDFLASDRYTFQRHIQVFNGRNVIVGTGKGTIYATETTQKQAWWNATPIAQPSSVGQTAGFTAGSGAAVKDDSTFTGGVGSKAYTIGDIVKHLKNEGLIASS